MFVLWFAGMEQTFRLFTADRFGMSDAAHRARVRARRRRERVRPGRHGPAPRAARSARRASCRGASASRRSRSRCSACRRCSAPAGKLALYVAAGLIAAGNGLTQPSLPAFASRRADPTTQGLTLGHAAVGLRAGPRGRPARRRGAVRDDRPAAPYFAGALGLLAAAILALARLR